MKINTSTFLSLISQAQLHSWLVCLLAQAGWGYGSIPIGFFLPHIFSPTFSPALAWFLHKLDGKIYSSTWSTSFLSFSVLDVHTAILHFFFLLCLCGILPFLKYVFRHTTNFADGLSCVLWWFHRCLGNQLCPAWGNPWPPLTQVHPCSPPLPAPATCTQYTFDAWLVMLVV